MITGSIHASVGRIFAFSGSHRTYCYATNWKMRAISGIELNKRIPWYGGRWARKEILF